MSDNKDKPADIDPDATVTGFRGLPKSGPDTIHDEDATVMMTRDALKDPPASKGDDDATVMMTRDALKGPDADATVMMPPGGFKAPAEPTPPAAFATDSDPEATATAKKAPPSILVEEPSRMPMIAGGVVVAAVILYFAIFGGKGTPPAAPKAEPVAAAPVAPAPAAPAPASPAPPAAEPAAPAPSAQSQVPGRLAALVKGGQVAVAEEGGIATITIRSDHQFASGGVDPEAKLRTLLQSIAVALDKVPGAIVVTGHADAKPSSNPKFPSNQELSAARGASAAKAMAASLGDPKRISSDGASDAKPLAPSDTAENRAKNRRVVITVKP